VICLRILSVLLLAGCPSPGLVTGLTGIKSQQGYTLNTEQKCVEAARAVEIADVALPIYLRQLNAVGYIKNRKLVDESKFSACLIEDPEPCRAGGWTKGPFGPTLPGEKYPLAARKRGCANSGFAWASKHWPPVCREVWKNEPHCVTADKVSTNNWEVNYLHELFNMVVLRWTNVYQPDYQAAIYKVIEPKASAAVLEALK